jgi:hypothetical protein
MRYEDLTALLEDLRRLAADEWLATIAGEITRRADGGWRRSALVGTTASKTSDARRLEGGAAVRDRRRAGDVGSRRLRLIR